MSPRTLHLGPYGLGTAALAGLYTPVGEEQAQQTLAAAWDAGVRLYDTAPHYGAGLAEERLGRFLQGRDRSSAVISSKVGRLLVPGRPQQVEEGFHGDPTRVRVRDYSRDGVLRSVEESLGRLRLDRLDVALVHDPDEQWKPAVEEALPALAGLRDQGVVGSIGVGMNQAAMLTRFVRESDLDLVLVAGRYTLLDASAAAELFPECLRRRVAVLAGGVFNGGVLADPRPGAMYDYAPAPPGVLRRAMELQRRCRARGVPLAAAALQFPGRHPAVTSVLVGARSAGEIERDLALAAHPVPEDLWAELEAP